MQPLTREPSDKSRERKNVPVKNFQKLRFTGTFEVHGKKKHCQIVLTLKC